MSRKNMHINDLLHLMGRLRDPVSGCPWDIKQSFETIIPYTIEEVYEPFLIQQGFIMRTPRGREVTEAAYKHLGKVKGPTQGGLF